MTASGWRCPECGLILAPSVTEHRCEPPTAGVPAFRPPPPDAPDITSDIREGLSGVSSIDAMRERLDMPAWTATTTTLTPAQIRQLVGEVQRALLRQAQRSRRPPGSAA